MAGGDDDHARGVSLRGAAMLGGETLTFTTLACTALVLGDVALTLRHR